MTIYASRPGPIAFGLHRPGPPAQMSSRAGICDHDGLQSLDRSSEPCLAAPAVGKGEEKAWGPGMHTPGPHKL